MQLITSLEMDWYELHMNVLLSNIHYTLANACLPVQVNRHLPIYHGQAIEICKEVEKYFKDKVLIFIVQSSLHYCYLTTVIFLSFTKKVQRVYIIKNSDMRTCRRHFVKALTFGYGRFKK